MNTGGDATHSCLFNPSLKPTHSVIPYKDIIQVVCKNEYYYSFLHKSYTQLEVQRLPFFCLLFALSTLGVAIKAQRVFPPQRKMAGSRKFELPRCTMDIRICSMRQLPVRFYAYDTIDVANHISDWSAPNFQEDPIPSTGSYCSQRRSGFQAMICCCWHLLCHRCIIFLVEPLQQVGVSLATPKNSQILNLANFANFSKFLQGLFAGSQNGPHSFASKKSKCVQYL